MSLPNQILPSLEKDFSDIWNMLSHSQKIILLKLDQSGWRLDYQLFDCIANIANIAHYSGKKGSVNYLGEISFF